MNLCKRCIWIILNMIIPMSLFAYDFEVGGYYYTVVSASDRTVKVESGPREGEIIIPEIVSYKGHTMNVIDIDVSAFEGADIISVTIPNSIKEIGKYSFRRCYNLKNVFGKVSANIREYAFADCYELRSIEITDGCSYIEGGAFDNCKRLKVINIPPSVQFIGRWAFRCQKILDINEDAQARKTIIIQDSSNPLIVPGDDNPLAMTTRKFDGSYYLGRQMITPNKGKVAWGEGYEYAKKVEFGDYVNDVFGIAEAFDARYLKEVWYGKRVSSIPAFHDAELTKIVIKNPIPPSVKGTFSNYIILNTDVYVPKESVDVYQAHPVWGQFSIHSL